MPLVAFDFANRNPGCLQLIRRDQKNLGCLEIKLKFGRYLALWAHCEVQGDFIFVHLVEEPWVFMAWSIRANEFCGECADCLNDVRAICKKLFRLFLIEHLGRRGECEVDCTPIAI